MICQIIQFNKYRDRYDNNIEYKEYYFWTKFMWMCSYDRFGYDKWIEQSDKYKNKTHSGLWDAIEKFRDSEYISIFEFKDKKDIVRNPLISRILDKYEEN